MVIVTRCVSGWPDNSTKASEEADELEGRVKILLLYDEGFGRVMSRS